MARVKLPRCRVCGIKKTKKNTCVRHDGYFMDLCLKCDSERNLARRLRGMSDEKLAALHAVHVKNARKVFEELERREVI